MKKEVERLTEQLKERLEAPPVDTEETKKQAEHIE